MAYRDRAPAPDLIDVRLKMPSLPARSAVLKRRPERREQILLAALRLFHERGYDATNMQDIGDMTGMTGPGIYRHFSNKQEILEFAVLEAGVRGVKQLEHVIAADLDPRALLSALLKNFIDIALNNVDLTILAARERKHLSLSTWKWVQQHDHQHRQLWERALLAMQPDMEAEEARLRVLGAMSLILGTVRGAGHIGTDHLATVVEEMAVAALRISPAS